MVIGLVSLLLGIVGNLLVPIFVGRAIDILESTDDDKYD
jgi:hypothetical protein